MATVSEDVNVQERISSCSFRRLQQSWSLLQQNAVHRGAKPTRTISVHFSRTKKTTELASSI